MTHSRQRETEEAKLQKAFQYDPSNYMYPEDDLIFLSRQEMKNYTDVRISTITTGPFFIEFLQESQKYFTVSTRLYLKHIFVTFYIRDEQVEKVHGKHPHTLNLGQFILRCPGVLAILKSYMEGKQDAKNLINFLQWLMGQYPEEWTRHYKPIELYQQKMLAQDSFNIHTYWSSPFTEKDLLIFEDINDTNYDREDVNQVNQFTEACKIFEKHELISNIYEAKLSRDPNFLDQESKSNLTRLQGMWLLNQHLFQPKKIIIQQYQIAKNKVKSELFSHQKNITESIDSDSSRLLHQGSLPHESTTSRGDLLPSSNQGKDRELIGATNQSTGVQFSDTTLMTSSYKTPMPIQTAFTSTAQDNPMGILNRERQKHNLMQNAPTTIISTPSQSSNQAFPSSSKQTSSIAYFNAQLEEENHDVQIDYTGGLAGSTFVKNLQTNQTERFSNVGDMTNYIRSEGSQESSTHSRDGIIQNETIPVQYDPINLSAGPEQLRQSTQLDIINSQGNEEREDQEMDDHSQNEVIPAPDQRNTQELDFVDHQDEKLKPSNDLSRSKDLDDEDNAKMDDEELKQSQQLVNDENMRDAQAVSQESDDDLFIVGEYQDPFNYDRYKNQSERKVSMYSKNSELLKIEKQKGKLFTIDEMKGLFPRLCTAGDESIELTTVISQLLVSVGNIFTDQIEASQFSDPFFYEYKVPYITRFVSKLRESYIVKSYASEVIDDLVDLTSEAKRLKGKFNQKNKNYETAFKIALEVQGLFHYFQIWTVVENLIVKELENIIDKVKKVSFSEYLSEINQEIVRQYFKLLKPERDNITKHTQFEVIQNSAQGKVEIIEDDSTKDEEMEDQTAKQSLSSGVAQSQVNSPTAMRNAPQRGNLFELMSQDNRDMFIFDYTIVLLNFIKFGIISDIAKSLLSIIHPKAFNIMQHYYKSGSKIQNMSQSNQNMNQSFNSQSIGPLDVSQLFMQGTQEQHVQPTIHSLNLMLETQANLPQKQPIPGPGQIIPQKNQQSNLPPREYDEQYSQDINTSYSQKQSVRGGKTSYNKPGTPMKFQFQSSQLSKSIQRLNEPNKTQQSFAKEYRKHQDIEFNPNLGHQTAIIQSMIQSNQSSGSNISTSHKAGDLKSKQQTSQEQQTDLLAKEIEKAQHLSSASVSIPQQMNVIPLQNSRERYEEIEKSIISKIESQLKYHNLVRNIDVYKYAIQFPLLSLSQFSFYEIFVERILEVFKLMDNDTRKKPQMPRGLIGDSIISTNLVEVIKYHQTVGKQYTDSVSKNLKAESLFPKLTALSGYTDKTKSFKHDIDQVMWLYNQLMEAELYISREFFVMLCTLRYDAYISAQKIFKDLSESLDEFDPYSIEHSSPYFLYDKKTLEPQFLNRVHFDYGDNLSFQLGDISREIKKSQLLRELLENQNEKLIVEIFFTVPKEYHGRVYFIAQLDSSKQIRVVSSQREERYTTVVTKEAQKTNLILKCCELKPSLSEPKIFAIRYYKVDKYSSILKSKSYLSRSLPQRLKLRNMLMLFFHYIKRSDFRVALSLMNGLGLAGIFAYLKSINVTAISDEPDWITLNDTLDRFTRDLTFSFQYQSKSAINQSASFKNDRGYFLAFLVNSYSLSAFDSFAVIDTKAKAASHIKSIESEMMKIPEDLKITQRTQSVIKQPEDLGQNESTRPSEQKVDEEMGSQDDAFNDEEYFIRDAESISRAASEIVRDQDHTDTSGDYNEILSILDNLQFKPYRQFKQTSRQNFRGIEEEFIKRNDKDTSSLRDKFLEKTGSQISYYRYFSPSPYQGPQPQVPRDNKNDQEESKEGHNFKQSQIEGYLGRGSQADANQRTNLVSTNKLNVSSQNPGKSAGRGQDRDASMDSVKDSGSRQRGGSSQRRQGRP